MWRVGRALGRTLYRNNVCVGMVDTPAIAEEIVAAMNASRVPTKRRDAYGLDAVCMCGHRAMDHVNGRDKCLSRYDQPDCECESFELAARALRYWTFFFFGGDIERYETCVVDSKRGRQFSIVTELSKERRKHAQVDIRADLVRQHELQLWEGIARESPDTRLEAIALGWLDPYLT